MGTEAAIIEMEILEFLKKGSISEEIFLVGEGLPEVKGKHSETTFNLHGQFRILIYPKEGEIRFVFNNGFTTKKVSKILDDQHEESELCSILIYNHTICIKKEEFQLSFKENKDMKAFLDLLRKLRKK